MRDLEVRDIAHAHGELLGETPVEAGEQHPSSRLGQVLRDIGGQDRLATTGRSCHRCPPAMQHVRTDERLLLGELHDLLVFFVEQEVERRTHLHPFAQGEGERGHASFAEMPTGPVPRRHDRLHAGRQVVQISAIDRHGRRSARMGVRVVHAVGESDAVPIGRSPLIPSRLRLAGSSPASASRRVPDGTDPPSRRVRRSVRSGTSVGSRGRIVSGRPWLRGPAPHREGGRSRSRLRPVRADRVRTAPSRRSDRPRTRHPIARGIPRRGDARPCSWSGASGREPCAP